MFLFVCSSSLSLDDSDHVFNDLLQVIVMIPTKVLSGVLVFQHGRPTVSCGREGEGERERERERRERERTGISYIAKV